MTSVMTKLRALAHHWRTCRDMRRLLNAHRSDALDSLYWYDIPLREAVSLRGFLRVAWSYLRGAAQDDIASAYGAGTFYWAPPRSDGMDEPAPSVWTCAALETQPFFDADTWCRKLEAAFDTIRAEYLAVQDQSIPNPGSAVDVGRGRWGNVFLTTTSGSVNPDIAAPCAQTLALLDTFPVCKNFGFAFFSISAPNTHIKPHTGGSNLRLRYHLGLDVPQPEVNKLRVARDTRHWSEGRAFAFDDGYDHEVWNDGTLPRGILIVDLWHPGLSESDIACLSDPIFNRFGKISA